MVIGDNKFAVVHHHDSSGTAHGLVGEGGCAGKAFVDLVLGIGVDVKAGGFAASEMLVGVRACSNGLGFERAEAAAVQLADFVRDDAAEVLFDIDGVYRGERVPLSRNLDATGVAVVGEGLFVGGDGRATAFLVKDFRTHGLGPGFALCDFHLA